MNTRLKPKSIKVLDEIIANPNINQTDAYLIHHKTTNRKAANVNAAKLLAKTSAQIYLEEHINLARQRIVSITKEGRDDIAIRAAQDILDREYGKATQKIEQHSTVVSLNLSLKDVGA